MILFSGDGHGDMLKSVYDTDNDGVVDEATVITNQGELATMDLADLNLSNKVDKVTGYSLTKNDLSDALKSNYDTAYTHSTITTGNPHDVTKTDVGLGNVDNTSDANKPVSGATQTALNLKQDSLGFTSENIANKVSSFQVTPDDTHYPTEKLVKDSLDGKQAGGNYFNKTSDDLDDITDGTTYKKYSDTEKTKLSGIEAGAEVNNISDLNATDLTDGNETTLHKHNLDNIIDGTTYKLITSAEKTVIGNTSGTNSGNETATTIGSLIAIATEITTPDDTDEFAIKNHTGGLLHRIAYSYLKSVISAYYDGLISSITALKTFTKDKFAMLGTSTGKNILSTANTSATNYTNILPAKDGTFAMTDDLLSNPLTAELNLGENTGLAFDAALSADGKYSGIVRAGTSGAALAFGELCYLNDADSRWELADANLSDGYDALLGICVLAANADGDATKLLLYGFARADAKFPTLTIGKPAYVSETAGAIVTAAPTTADSATRIIGFGTTADELYFKPSNDYYTHT
jgi:hypothetical protein